MKRQSYILICFAALCLFLYTDVVARGPGGGGRGGGGRSGGGGGGARGGRGTISQPLDESFAFNESLRTLWWKSQSFGTQCWQS